MCFIIFVTLQQIQIVKTPLFSDRIFHTKLFSQESFFFCSKNASKLIVRHRQFFDALSKLTATHFQKIYLKASYVGKVLHFETPLLIVILFFFLIYSIRLCHCCLTLRYNLSPVAERVSSKDYFISLFQTVILKVIFNFLLQNIKLINLATHL